jgi:hypothetical protein
MSNLKKTVKIKETHLVDLIDNIVTETVALKKQEWLNEQANKRSESSKLMEAKIAKLERAVRRLTEGK